VATDPVREELLCQLAQAEGQMINAASQVGDACRALEAATEIVEHIRIQIQIHELTKTRHI